MLEPIASWLPGHAAVDVDRTWNLPDPVIDKVAIAFPSWEPI